MSPQLEWQSELDATLADIDTRLQHPRRRSSDTGPQPTLPELGQVDLTSELLDEIAWRVAEQIRHLPHPALPAPAAPAAAEAHEPPPSGLLPGKMLMVRYRLPRLPWPLSLLRRRRRQHRLTTLKSPV